MNLGTNTFPTANAGPDKNVGVGTRVILDGLASTDNDGDPLSYSWQQTQGPAVTLENPNSSTPSFIATQDAVYEFAVTVTDDRGGSDIDTVRVFAGSARPSGAPFADAGQDQTVNEGDAVTLRGGNSADPDGAPLTFSWRQISGPDVSLSNVFITEPTFTAPQVDAEVMLVFELTVTDDTSLNGTTEVIITVRDRDSGDDGNTGGLCETVSCPDGSSCDSSTGMCSLDDDGSDLCANVACAGGFICDPSLGDCVPDVIGDLCANVACDAGSTCDPITGDCVPDNSGDLCANVACDDGSTCDPNTGDCVPDDGETTGDLSLATLIYRASAVKLFDRTIDKPIALGNAVRGIAMSGNGSKLWVMTDERTSTEEIRLFRINTADSGLIEIDLPPELQDPFAEHTPASMAADSTGDTCVIVTEGGGDTIMWKATTTGLTRLLALSDQGDAITNRLGELEITADGSTAVFLADDVCCGSSDTTEVFSISTSGAGAVILVFDENNLVDSDGNTANTINSIEIDATGTRITAIGSFNIDNSFFPNEVFLFDTSTGTATQLSSFGVLGGQAVFDVGSGVNEFLSVSADANTVAVLTNDPDLASLPRVPSILASGSSRVVSRQLDLRVFGIARDASIGWGANSSGGASQSPRDIAVRSNLTTGTFLAIDDFVSNNSSTETLFMPCNCPGGGSFQVPDISDDGSVMVTADGDFAYALHVGNPLAVSGAPVIDKVETLLSPTGSQLTVRITVSDPDGSDDIQLVQLTFTDANGIELTKTAPEAENPFFSERFGVLVPAANTPGVYQATYTADAGKEAFVANTRVRITVLDKEQHYGIADFRPIPVPGETEDTNGDGTAD